MRKILVLFLVCVIAVRSQAQLLTEPFNYTPDPTLGLAVQSGGVWLKVNTGDSILITAGSLSYSGLSASTGNKIAFDGAGTDYYTDFTSQTSGSVYYSFILNVSSLGSLGTTGGYFTGFIQSGSTSLFGGTVWTRLSTTAGKFNVGVSTRSNTAVTWLAADLTPGTPVFVVVAYDFIAGTANDVARIWLNTANIGGSEPAPDATAVAGTDLASAARILVRQDNATNTPFIEMDELRVGTTWAQVTPASAVPTLSASTLPSFGNVCINTVSAPNSFTITGTNLSTANVTVGALAGYTYSTTSGGTYTTSLSLTQPGGSYSQQIFVKFSPTAVQSYNGNIPVGGGGASTVNAAATGSGINDMPTVTTGGTSSITQTTATAAGTITATGCSAVTAYGIEFSTTNGFANGSGTQVASSNLSGGNFSSGLSGLSPATTYYYKAYATNGGGTAYGTQQSFVTLSAVPNLSATTLASFGNVCINTTTAPNSFTITGTNLTTANVDVSALAGFSYSTSAGGTYTSSLSIPQPGGSFSQQIFVKFTPTAVQSYNGNINVSGGGATTISVAAAGAGVNSIPSVTSGAASAITQTTATVAGTITDPGCSAVSAYGIEYSTTNGFANGSGTAVSSSNLSGGNFTSGLSGLAASTTYYYHAYATNTAGTGYGAQLSFTTVSPNPAISTTALTGFGNVCVNTTAGPNSFTINGTNLTSGNVTVAALAGFTYSTTAGGIYTTTLSFSQPGGTFTQQVFVKFTPTAVQSYNGNIVVDGGGISSPVNVAATGSGVNSAPTVTSGTASAITSTSATVAGTINSTGCTAVTTYGIEYSTTNGFANGSGTAVASSNISGGVYSSALAGLNPSTVYYYHAYATNGGGTGYGSQLSFTTLTPSLSSTTLTAFGSVCVNSVAGPNSFTITGTNLTSSNITVGPLAGFTFSTTSGGTYTNSLSLVQPGGAFSQQVFVKFSPTAVQSYSGNIPVAGGGASAINVAASGAGVNTAPSVTTGAASAVTQNSATAAGSIPATGCSAISAYGIEYSTTNGFSNGSGTQVASSNLAGGNFSSSLTGLAPTTTYYYKAYATNGGGTTYGAQQSFTTSTPVLSATALTGFGSVCISTTAGPNSFTISGTGLTNANVTVGPLAGYSFSTTAGGTYSSALTLSQPGGAYSQQVFVKFNPAAVQSYNGNIPVSGGGAATINVAATGSGVNTLATVATGTATDMTNHSATLQGSITGVGCSAITSYGIELSGVNGFVNGSGTKYPSTNLNALNNFSSALTGLVQGGTYYFKAYATNSGGTAYGSQQTFTLPVIADGFSFYPVPASKGQEVRISMGNLKPGYYGLQFFNSDGKLVWQKDMNIQVNFINQSFTMPYLFTPGIYRVRLVNELGIVSSMTITVL
jgi:hypothetical protein